VPHNARRTSIALVAVLTLASLLLLACAKGVEEKAEETATPDIVRPQPTEAVILTPAPTETAEPQCPNPYPAIPLAEDAQPPFRITPAAVVEPPSPFEPLPFRQDATLERLIREQLGDNIDSYGVVVKKIADGSGAAVNADKVFNAASLFKVTVMYEVFHQRAAGLISFDWELVVTPYYESFGLGPRLTSLCQSLTVREALQAMMAASDNAAAVMLQDLAGPYHINESMAALGLIDTRLLEDSLPATAQDMALLLEMIARGQAVDRAASQEMIDLMSLESLNDRLPALLPEGTLVAHKTANWSDATHDVGIVYSPQATYVIAVLSDKEYDPEPIAELSRVVYEYYNGEGSAGTSSPGG
jgi:beta-lactamase class A